MTHQRARHVVASTLLVNLLGLGNMPMRCYGFLTLHCIKKKILYWIKIMSTISAKKRATIHVINYYYTEYLIYKNLSRSSMH
jgi:hypothetical protein